MTKFQRIPKPQAPNSIGVNQASLLELDVWDFFGIWNLGIGILHIES